MRARLMIAPLLYAYCLDEWSSRQIERLCEPDMAYRVIAANQRPDHTTLTRFQNTHATALAALFTDVLRLCAEAGGTMIGVVALAANPTAGAIKEAEETMLIDVQGVDEVEDRWDETESRGDELPAALQGQKSRLAHLQACQVWLKQEVKLPLFSGRPMVRSVQQTGGNMMHTIPNRQYARAFRKRQ